MAEIKVTDNSLDFSELHQRMQWYVDEDILPCASTLVMSGLDVLDYRCFGTPHRPLP